MAEMSLLDPFGRKINYLRLSVTGRCNLRCSYCRPAGGEEALAVNEILSDDELLLLARTAVGLGIENIRVTGGEPLVRKGIVGLLSRFAAIPGLKKLVLTTNGLHLKESGGALRKALQDVIRGKPDRHLLSPEGFGGKPFAMSAVGG